MSNLKILLYAIVLIILIQSISFGQYQNIRITNLYSATEPSIVINPKNPNQIVVGANNNRYYSDTSMSGYYYTTNGGLNWSEGPIKSTNAGPGGDPCIVVDTNGYFYYTQNVFVHQTPGLNVVLIAKSTNGGANWPFTNIFGQNGTKQNDKPWACVDLTHSAYGNNVYVTWTQFDQYASTNSLDSSRIMFSRSTDGGLTFTETKRICRYGGDCTGTGSTVYGPSPCVGPNGEVYVSWTGPMGILFNKSSNGGVNWMATEVTAVPPYSGGWYFSVPGITICSGIPATCCDVSNGPYRGTIYINWVDKRNGTNDADVWLTKSTNGGLNWSAIKRVNNDPAGKHQFFNWMTIDPITGYLYVIFYDRRNYTNNSTDVYLARSTDGGETFGNVKISQTSFTPLTNVFIGDYNCISVFNNKIRPVWTRNDGSVTSIWTAIIDTLSISIRNISNQVPDKYSLSQNYPNPFNPSTNIKFNIAKSGDVKIIVYDITGREVQTLVNEKLQAGTYEAAFDGSRHGGSSTITSGVYFYKLQSGDFVQTKHMVLIK